MCTLLLRFKTITGAYLWYTPAIPGANQLHPLAPAGAWIWYTPASPGVQIWYTPTITGVYSWYNSYPFCIPQTLVHHPSYCFWYTQIIPGVNFWYRMASKTLLLAPDTEKSSEQARGSQVKQNKLSKLFKIKPFVGPLKHFDDSSKHILYSDQVIRAVLQFIISYLMSLILAKWSQPGRAGVSLCRLLRIHPSDSACGMAVYLCGIKNIPCHVMA